MDLAGHLVEIAGRARHRHGWRPAYRGAPSAHPDHADLFGMTPPANPPTDLRALAPAALDQGAEATCTAHATRYAMSVLRSVRGVPAHDDSRRMLYWCGRVAAGLSTVEDSGCTIDGAITAALRAGSCSETEDPYPDGHPDLLAAPVPPNHYVDASPFKMRAAATCFGASGARFALANGHPVVCGVLLFASIRGEAAAATGAISLPAEGEDAIGGHALCLLHDDLQNGVVWALNSWSSSWGATAPDGRRGWALLSYEYLARYGSDYHAAIGI